MNRRAMLGAAVAASPVALAAPALAQTAMPEVRWRLTSSFPRTLDVLFSTPELIARRVATLTDNKFRISVFPAGEIVGGLQALDAVQAGTLEAAHTASYYYVGKEPGFAFFTAMPFGLNTRQMTAWLRHGGGRELQDTFFNEYNIKAIPAGDTGAQMGGWFRNEVRSLADLNGLKFRIAGFAGQVFQRLGAAPTQVAAADIYPSLERGTLDAVEFVGPHDDERLGFVRVARNYYAPGFWEPGARLHFMANQRAWDALPDLYKAAIEVACAEADSEMVSKYDHLNPLALRRLVAAGAQLRFWPREILQAAWRESNALYEETASKNPRFKAIWDSYKPYRTDQYQWFRVAENSFDNFAFAAAAQQ
ncbi:TRAP-type mannitol/chloroaromatic compound transport system substrate-binding protein [Humitalea rosea]|uniref:TRAP-type mannitol/chloroaromatic compound transport system substrate-binding protein n=1 Tax=Humitalea rosea TaxID=990373 RepID=A0A2W7IFG3_9PROT|nr:TRAP transporter substrate-binding protein DctP [Humitalea rosea]PZW45648.1 TRAP-type mannitol/chloroaromatic compound transport system substrate-binding protein [Humitalea rosea]